MNVFDVINTWSADELLRHIELPLANDGKSFVCPVCNNGRGGGKGDGIKPRTNSKGQTRWKCFKCGKDFSNFDLATASLGYSEYDTAEAVKSVEERLGIRETTAPVFFSREKVFSHFSEADRQASRSAPSSKSQTAPASSEVKDYSKLYEYCRGNVAKFLSENGGSYRGLTGVTFEKYGLGVHPAFGLEGEKKVPALIIPYNEKHFVARKLKDVEGNQKVTQHGTGARLYEAVKISQDSPNFIFEGELDALSAAQVIGSLGIGCIATGGASKWRKVITELEKRYGAKEEKPSFIVVYDNDETGKRNGLELAIGLRGLGYATELFFFEEKMSGSRYREDTGEEYTVEKVDANDLLQKNADSLAETLISVIDRFDVKLREQKAAIQTVAEQKQKAEENRSGIKEMTFAEYFSGSFFGDIEVMAKYSNRKTGFRNIDEKQIFMPGLYLLGALPATGKTSFAWQLVNQLSDEGEPCIYCSYEMSMLELYVKTMTRELFRRYPEVSRRLNLTSGNIRRGAGYGVKEFQELAEEFGRRKEKRLRVMELSNTSVTELIRKLKTVTEGGKSPVVVVDYLQIMPHGKENAKSGIDDALLRLKDYQRETNATLIVISSFNRENYWQAASFSSFKESGAIEYSADSVWALQNHGVDAEGNLDKTEMMKMSREKIRKIKLSCLKNRNGSAYDCYFRYYAEYDYFEAIEDNEENARRSYEH